MCSSLSAVSIACRWSRLLAALFTVLLSVPWVSVVQADDPLVAVLTAENWEQLVPQGKEVDAIYGDVVLRNDFVTAVIARPDAARHANMTIRSVGGCLIDLAVRGHESDQLGAFFPGRRAFAFTDLRIAESKRLGGRADVTVTAAGSEKAPEFRTEWSLGAGDRFLTAVSTWKNTTSADLAVILEDAVRADGGKEDMPKCPDGDRRLFWFHDIHWQQAYGVHVPGFRMRSKNGNRETDLAYEPESGGSVVLKPGESVTLRRMIYVNTDLPAVRADHADSLGTGGSLQSAVLRVTAANGPISGARVELRSGDDVLGTVVTGAEGTVPVRLPAGNVTAVVSIDGQQFESREVTLTDGRIQLRVDEYRGGQVQLQIVDEAGRPLPAKVEFAGRTGTVTPRWAPETAEYFVKNVAYTASGTVQARLAAGEYDVTVSHGPEYNAEFMKLQVEAGGVTQRTVVLPRVVSTEGWVSADFHSHSTPSGDNTSSQLGRVLNLAAEHVEFAPCTEHNRVSTYADHLRTLQLAGYLATVEGMELTGQPLPLNHQNVFPMRFRPRTQDGGGPVTDVSPEAQMERLAAWDENSVKLIQQNHPDVGWLFYDKDGNQQADGGHERSFGLINVMEIHPIDKLLKRDRFDIRGGKPIENHTALNWLQLLNQGFRIYGVVNTDSHYNYHGSGGLRIWLKSSTDDPAGISSDEMRDVSREGRIIMSNGPYLEASFGESGSAAARAISGEDLRAASGKVTGRIRVQCANWLDIDTVQVLVNGRPADGLTFTRQSHPQLFGTGVVKFEQSVELQLAGDAHLVVLVGHATQVLGGVVGPDWGQQHPTALSNPVFVDVDGGGFRANRDTLDIPLPVKFVAPK